MIANTQTDTEDTESVSLACAMHALDVIRDAGKTPTVDLVREVMTRATNGLIQEEPLRRILDAAEELIDRRLQ